jgi:hypothetical protein
LTVVAEAPRFGSFTNLAIGSLPFVTSSLLTTFLSRSGASVLTLLLVTVSLRHFLIIYIERQHICFISTSRVSLSNQRFHDFGFPPWGEQSNFVDYFVRAGARITLQFREVFFYV